MNTITARIRARLSKRAICGIALLIIFGIALALRVSVPYENIFTGDGIIFGGKDPWYHMRLVENLVQHFPHRIAFDPFTFYPFGQDVPFAPFFDLLLGFVIWVIGLGSPSQHTIETVGAYFPAILGALVTIPVYFIGRELFNRNVGLLSAGLIAILPGQFLYRSLLGFTDHHIAEFLFSTTAALFLILAIKRAKEKETSFSHIRSRDWANLRKPLIYALLAGLALGIYLLSWVGGPLFVFIIFVYMIIQYIIDHLRGKSSDYLCIIGVPMFLIALIMVIPFSNSLLYGELVIASLTICMLTPAVLSGISLLMAQRSMKPAYYPLALAGLGLASVGVFYAIDPSLLDSMLGRFDVFTTGAAAETIAEVQSLLSIGGLTQIVFYFTTGIFLALIALGLIIHAQVKGWNSEKIFLIVWCLIMLAAMLAQSRFAYYFAVNVALLAGYLCWRILESSWSRLREALPEDERENEKEVQGKEPRRSLGYYLNARYVRDATWALIVFLISGKREGAKKKEAAKSVRSRFRARYAGMAGIAMIVFLVAFVPNIGVAIGDAGETGGPNEAWYSSLIWMRDNTPDPFGDPNFYYELYDKPTGARYDYPGPRYDYPESAYGVMNWWDYGHWITRIAHRIPNSNPFQTGAKLSAQFFTAQDESSANELLDMRGHKYVIIDYKMATTIFASIGIWARESESHFLEAYMPAEGVGLKILYYPEYYRSMCSRLYNFGGKAIVPHNSTIVISYEETTFLGTPYKQITSTQSFATYEEAQEYLESQTDPNYRIVGMDPFTSPVPLEELEHYELVHRSDPEMATKKKEEPIPYVKIFEYLP